MLTMQQEAIRRLAISYLQEKTLRGLGVFKARGELYGQAVVVRTPKLDQAGRSAAVATSHVNVHLRHCSSLSNSGGRRWPPNKRTLVSAVIADLSLAAQNNRDVAVHHAVRGAVYPCK